MCACVHVGSDAAGGRAPAGRAGALGGGGLQTGTSGPPLPILHRPPGPAPRRKLPGWGNKCSAPALRRATAPLRLEMHWAGRGVRTAVSRIDPGPPGPNPFPEVSATTGARCRMGVARREKLSQ